MVAPICVWWLPSGCRQPLCLFGCASLDEALDRAQDLKSVHWCFSAVWLAPHRRPGHSRRRDAPRAGDRR